MRLHPPFLAVAAIALLSSSAAAQEIRGRVVEDPSRQAVSGFAVTLHTGDRLVGEAKTDANGFYRFRVDAAGTYRIEALQPGFMPVQQEVTVAAADVTVPAMVLKPQVFELDSIEAEARRRRPEPVSVGFSRASHVMAGERLATLEQHGARVLSALRQMTGVRVVEWNDRNGRARFCVESRRRMVAFNEAPDACHWTVLVVDGIALGTSGAEETMRTFHLRDFESIEYLPPAEAAQKYGMDAGTYGALLLWTRGRGPHVSEARNR
jgi:hypothetical protein